VLVVSTISIAGWARWKSPARIAENLGGLVLLPPGSGAPGPCAVLADPQAAVVGVVER
jgi:hypothetical protein